MSTTFKQASKLVMIAAFAIAFVGCAKNLEGQYTGTETNSQGGAAGYGTSGTFRVQLDEANGSVHGTWTGLNPQDNSVAYTGSLSGTRNGESITDVRLTLFQSGGFQNIGNMGYFGAWSAVAMVGCGNYVGNLTLSNNRLFGTLNCASSGGVDPNTGQPIPTTGMYGSGSRLIDASRAE